ncbi:hypothetical protein HOG21_03235 [bacterium]|nr:hypothetical protein [bacterium]
MCLKYHKFIPVNNKSYLSLFVTTEVNCFIGIGNRSIFIQISSRESFMKNAVVSISFCQDI